MSDLETLLDQYWRAAHAEGKEGRDHDTEDGVAQRTLAEIRELFATANERIRALAFDFEYEKQLHVKVEAQLAAVLVDQREVSDKLEKTLEESRMALESANAWPDGGGPIVDTIWYTATETLFDFMDAAIAEVAAIRRNQIAPNQAKENKYETL